MKAGGRRKPPRATIASLSALGAEPLAELLLAASRGDTGLKRVLTLAVATDPRDMAEEADRQVQRLRTGNGRPVVEAFASITSRVAGLIGAVAQAARQLELVDPLRLAFASTPPTSPTRCWRPRPARSGRRRTR